jgi:hypothetical protein
MIFELICVRMVNDFHANIINKNSQLFTYHLAVAYCQHNVGFYKNKKL